MTIGTSMDLETCLILRQVSLNLLYWKKNLLTKSVVRVEINEKTADTQARSVMARNLENNGKERQAEGEAKSHEKPQLENARKLRGIYFIDQEDKEFKQSIKNARKNLGTSMAPAMLCKIKKKNCGSGASN